MNKLTITVNFKKDDGLDMEINLNKAIKDLSEALEKKGLRPMDLSAQNFPHLSENIYTVTIE